MTEEMCHIRCSCGKVIEPLYRRFKEKISEGVHPQEALDTLTPQGRNLRWCCRMKIMTPFKIVSKVDRQEAVQNLQQTPNNFSVINADQKIQSPLQAMSVPSLSSGTPSPSYSVKGSSGRSYTIVPESTSTIQLPEMPQIDLGGPDDTGPTTFKKYYAI